MQTKHNKEEHVRGDVIDSSTKESGETKRLREDAVEELNIIGSHSGCRFELEHGRLIKHQNNCKGAMMMQAKYRSDLYLRPQVYWWNNNKFCMEYISDAVPMAKYVSTLSAEELRQEAQRMIDKTASSCGDIKMFDGNLLKVKIVHVISRLTKEEDVKLAARVMNSIEDYYEFPSGEYHGDLTMANILYANKQPYLIDFLPGYIDSPVLDMVKLKQEYKLKWCCLIMGVDESYFHFIGLLKAMVEYHFKDIDTTIIEAINLLRILPYVKDEDIHSIITNNIKLLLS